MPSEHVAWGWARRGASCASMSRALSQWSALLYGGRGLPGRGLQPWRGSWPDLLVRRSRGGAEVAVPWSRSRWYRRPG